MFKFISNHRAFNGSSFSARPANMRKLYKAPETLTAIRVAAIGAGVFLATFAGIVAASV